MGRNRKEKKIKTKRKKGLLAAVLILCLLGTGLTGCTFPPERRQDTTPDSAEKEDTVFTFGGCRVTLGEVWVYATTVREEYEENYGKDIWQMDVSSGQDDSLTLEDEVRQDVVEEIIRVKMLNEKAPDYGISLTSTDRDGVASETDAFYGELTDAQISEMHLTRDLVQQVLTENALARKMTDSLLEKADIQVSDEEARETTFYDLYFPFYNVASDGDVSEIPEEDRQTQYEKALQAYNTLVNPIENAGSPVSSETNIEGLAEYYGLKDSAYYTMTPAEIEDVYGKNIRDTLYDLEDGSCSLVTKSEYGYHIFYMKALTDREATDSRKQELQDSREKEYLDSRFEKWKKETDPSFSYEKSVNQKLYREIRF